jgi:hypothetical protein
MSHRNGLLTSWMSEESDPRLYHAHVARNRLTESRSMSTTPGDDVITFKQACALCCEGTVSKRLVVAPGEARIGSR